MSEMVSSPEQKDSIVVSLAAGDRYDLTPRRADDPSRLDTAVIRHIVCLSGLGELSVGDSNVIDLAEGVSTDVPATQCELVARRDGPGVEVSYSDRSFS